MTGTRLPVPVRTYDTQRDDYCVEWELDGEVVFALRAEDTAEPESRDGRGLRFCVGDTELPLDWLRAEIDAALPWLVGQGET